MSRYGDVYENHVTGERAVVLRGEEDGAGEPGLVHLTVKPGGAVVGEHVHPNLHERFRVVGGTLGTRIGGVETELNAGEEATVPAGTPHDWWNAGAGQASVLVELTPPDPRFEAMIATLFGLANAGKTNAKGLPNPFQLALVVREFADTEYLRPHSRAVPDPDVVALAGLTPPPPGSGGDPTWRRRAGFRPRTRATTLPPDATGRPPGGNPRPRR